VLRYRNGLFLPEGSMSSLDKVAREAKADDGFLDLFERFATEGRNVSDKPTANAYAPTSFAHGAEAKKHHLRKADLEASMRRLFAEKKYTLRTMVVRRGPHRV